MKMLGEDCINNGFCWESATGIYYVIFKGRRGRGAQVRDYILPRRVPQRVTLPSLKFE